MKDVFSHKIRTDDIFFKYARGVSDRSGKEFHLYHEIIFFLEGDAELICEDMHIRLKPQTLILIPKEQYHQVVIHKEAECYQRCVVQFGEIHVPRQMMAPFNGHIFVTENTEHIHPYFSKMISLSNEKGHAFSREVLSSLLILLLDEIRGMRVDPGLRKGQSPLTQKALAWVGGHLTQEVTMQEIADACNTSLSSLSHTFKKDMNISLYQYILKKRLVLAHMKISGGKGTQEAAMECGFRDYSGFFRQYKKMFDLPPSKK